MTDPRVFDQYAADYNAAVNAAISVSGESVEFFARLKVDLTRVAVRRPRQRPVRGLTPARPEIWAYGFRNPRRFSFDRLTGDFYIADVGQGHNVLHHATPSLISRATEG